MKTACTVRPTDPAEQIIKRLLPAAEKLEIQQMRWTMEGVTLHVASIQQVAQCPVCGQETHRIHSTYTRTLQDLPWGAFRLQLQVDVHRFFCLNPACIRKVFTERLPELMEPSARRTTRLRDALCSIGWALGGRAGARQCAAQAVPVCATTLLTLLRRTGMSAAPTPRVLGVDDWSFRARQAGTLLVDLERHQPVDLLMGSDEEGFAQWLRDHPGIEIISRDRGTSYLNGATKGAPLAKQVLDRWHLCKNLEEILQRSLARQMDVLRQAGKEVNEKRQNRPSAPPQPRHVRGRQCKPPRRKAPVPSPQRAWQLSMYQQVHELAAEGISHREIASRLQIQRQTVRKYLRLPEFVDRRHSPFSSHIEPYQAYLQQRWEQGEIMIKRLWQEIQQQGFTGSYSSLWKFLRTWPLPAGMISSTTSDSFRPVTRSMPTTRTPRQTMWLLLRNPEELSETDRAYRQVLFRLAPALENFSTLARGFLQMLKKRDGDAFLPWLNRAKVCPVEEMRRFALG